MVVVVVGLVLAVSPLAAARFTAWARYAPYSTDQRSVRYYRLAGVGICAVGIALMVAAAS